MTVKNFVRLITALAAAVLLGCAAATPFQPNANASNTANNSAQANPAVSVSVPPGQPTATQPAAPPSPAWIAPNTPAVTPRQ